MDNIISIQHVTKQFKTQTVLNNVSVDFLRGSIYGLVGRNGSGKTMLMKCICGFVPPTSDKIFVQGKQVRYGSQFPKGIGFIIESPGFLRTSSGIANLKHLTSINRQIGMDEVREAMKMVGLDPDSRKYVGRYSLGMRQRLGIAQAIMDHPDSSSCVRLAACQASLIAWTSVFSNFSTVSSSYVKFYSGDIQIKTY